MNLSTLRNLFRYVCLNWKVVVGLGVVGLGVWLLAPRFLLSALPLLILAACPLSMLVMMVGMNKMRQPQQESASQILSVPEHEETTNWRRVPAGAVSTSPSRPATRDERLTELHRQLARLQTEQHALHAELAQFAPRRPSAEVSAPTDPTVPTSRLRPLSTAANDEPIYATPS